MIRCNFSKLIGERKLKVSAVSRDTGIGRGTLTRLYYETVERVDLADIDTLCKYFGITVDQLFEYVPPRTPNE